MINKFLYPNGGSETYMLKVGACLQQQGHKVQYFGMEHEGRCVGNRVHAYTTDMDFHSGSILSKLTYPIKTIYSGEARRKIRLVLDDFKPDVCHLNNFNYQLTPSIILEIEKWREQGNPCKIIYTAHDYQLVCPNHMCRNPNTNENCEKCLGGHFNNCIQGHCIHNSKTKSIIGAAEATFWNRNGVYKYIDCIICCSDFLKAKLDTNPLLAKKTVMLHNFVDLPSGSNKKSYTKKNYVLYFGRYSREKGIETLLNATKALPDIPFVFAGNGNYRDKMKNMPNVRDVGYMDGDELYQLIREAQFSVCPSEWYENCPFSVLESIANGTPVIGSDIGGIPELIRNGVTGELFKSSDCGELKSKIEKLWKNKELVSKYSCNCRNISFDTIDAYTKKLLTIYS